MATENDVHKADEARWEEAASLLGGDDDAASVARAARAAPFESGERAAIAREVRAALGERSAEAKIAHIESRRRSRRLMASLVVGMAAAAGLAAVLSMDPAIGEVGFELDASQSVTRGSGAVVLEELHVRNEPGWTIRLPPGSDERRWALYLVEIRAGELVALPRPPVMAGQGVLNVQGEVGALGLRPGEVRVMFLVGPVGAADDDVMRVAAAYRAGEAVPRAWAVAVKSVRVVE